MEHRRIGDGARPELLHFAENGVDLPPAAVVDGEDGHAGAARGPVQSAHDFGREGRGDEAVGDDADQRQPALAHAARGKVGHVAEFVGDGLDLLPRVVRHAGGAAV